MYSVHASDSLCISRVSQVAALAEGVEFRNMQYFDKPPTSLYGPGKTSQATPPHQDAYYFMIAPPQQAVTAWMALDLISLDLPPSPSISLDPPMCM